MNATRLRNAGLSSTMVLLGGLVIVVATGAAYYPALSGEFIFDDNMLIGPESEIRRGDALKRIWLSDELVDYWPVFNSVLWFQWKLFGDWTTGYHLVNLAVHVLNALLLWRLLHRWTVPASYCCSLAFALHPVNVEAVAWISQIKTTLATTFLFGAILCFQSYLQQKGIWRYSAALACHCAGVLTKTSVVMAPVVLAVMAWSNRRTGWRRIALELSPYFVVSLAAGLSGILFQQKAVADAVVREDGFLGRLAMAGNVVWFYFSKAIFPTRLCFVYPKWALAELTVVEFVPLAAILFVTIAIGLWSRRRSTQAWAGVGFYLLMLFPVLGFVDIAYMHYSLVADHWQYTALPGVLATTIGGAAYLLRGRAAWIRCSLATVFGAALFGGTTYYARDYQSALGLWQATLARNPEAQLAIRSIGEAHLERGEFDQAIEYFDRAIELDPESAQAHHNLGYAVAQLGRWEEAIRHYHRSLDLQPDLVIAHRNLGVAYASIGRLEPAIAAQERALELAPDNAEAMMNLGILYSRKGLTTEAERLFRDSLAQRPYVARTHYNYAGHLARQRRQDEAIELYRQAVRLDTAYGEAWANLGALLAAKGQTSAAIEAYLRAASLLPNSALVHKNLGQAYLTTNQVELAAQRFERALQINPAWREAARLLEQANAVRQSTLQIGGRQDRETGF